MIKAHQHHAFLTNTQVSCHNSKQITTNSHKLTWKSDRGTSKCGMVVSSVLFKLGDSPRRIGLSLLVLFVHCIANTFKSERELAERSTVLLHVNFNHQALTGSVQAGASSLSHTETVSMKCIKMHRTVSSHRSSGSAQKRSHFLWQTNRRGGLEHFFNPKNEKLKPNQTRFT